MPARVLNILLGIWLFISAFVWPHGRAQLTNRLRLREQTAKTA